MGISKKKPLQQFYLSFDDDFTETRKSSSQEPEFKDYPNLIAEVEKTRNNLATLVKSYKELIVSIEANVDLLIANSENLTNADKRKAARKDLLSKNSEYQLKLVQLINVEQELLEIDCERDRLVRMFRVLELDRMEAIARMMFAGNKV